MNHTTVLESENGDLNKANEEALVEAGKLIVDLILEEAESKRPKGVTGDPRIKRSFIEFTHRGQEFQIALSGLYKCGHCDDLHGAVPNLADPVELESFIGTSVFEAMKVVMTERVKKAPKSGLVAISQDTIDIFLLIASNAAILAGAESADVAKVVKLVDQKLTAVLRAAEPDSGVSSEEIEKRGS